MTEEAGVILREQYQNYKRQKCFVAYSEQAEWSPDLLSSCEEILSQSEYDLEIDYVRKHYESDVTLRQKALDLIANARYGIYDISYWRQDEKSAWQIPKNVFIELGIAIALNRPILLLRHGSNQDLKLPSFLEGLSENILEFTGTKSLKDNLEKHLFKWIKEAPEEAWRNHNCTFGDRWCEYREAYPKAKQQGKKELNCIVADGLDICRPDFRGVVEEVLNRFRDVTYTYLDSLSLQEGYNFKLCSLCQKIRSSPFSIYHITSETPPEVFISIGISIALEAQFEYKIPKIFITKNIQYVPSLLSGYEVVIAKNDKERKRHLKQFLPSVINKSRATVWKPRPLPFIEPVSITEESSSENTDVQTNTLDIERVVYKAGFVGFQALIFPPVELNHSH